MQSAAVENKAGLQRPEIVLVDPKDITATKVRAWRSEGFTGVALVLDARFDKDAYTSSASAIGQNGLDLYYWIEIGRNPELAEKHPEWMASLGMHDDWLKRFPTAKAPGKDEVAKAFPWVPIRYREAFDAHLQRIERLLQLVPPDYRGLLLNDLQGGPASCGCGNLQCRWATDYHVPATGTKANEDDVAAKFVAEVKRRARDKAVIPIWTTECDEEDLPKEKRAGEWTTGFSGTVGCAVGSCPKDFTKQWSALTGEHRGPIGLLALHREFGRVFLEYGEETAWIKRAVDYVDRTLRQNGSTKFPHEQLWLVVQGFSVPESEERAARGTAAKAGVGGIVVARTRIDQSYEPRSVSVRDQ